MLEVTDIHVSYGDVEALRGVSLTVGDGEMVALVGANGAGKTTTLRTITGLMAPRSGDITFDGERISGLHAYDVVDHGVAHLPEGRELFSDLSVMDNLRLGNWSRRKGGSFRKRRDEVMDHFPILRDRSGQAAGTLSGGEQQMLGVARALMSDPKLLVVDELSLGLAPQIVTQLFEILRAVNAEGMSVLLVEQFVHMALGNTHRAYALAKGEVVLDGDSPELLDSPDLMAVYLGETGDPGADRIVSADEPQDGDAPVSVSANGSPEDGSGAVVDSDMPDDEDAEHGGIESWAAYWDDEDDDFEPFEPEPTRELPVIGDSEVVGNGRVGTDPVVSDDTESAGAGLDEGGDEPAAGVTDGSAGPLVEPAEADDDPTEPDSEQVPVPGSVEGPSPIEIRVRRR